MDELSDLMWKSVGAAGAPTSKSAPNASLNQLSATHHAAAAPPRGPGSRRMGDGAVPLGTPSPPISGSSSSGIRPAMGFGAGFGTPPPPAAASGPVSASATALAGVAPLLGAWPSGLTPRLASPDQDRAHRSAATSAPRTPQPAAAMATATATASLVDADPFRRLVPDLGRQPATPPTLAAASLTGIATLRAGIAQPQAQPLLPRMQTGPAMDTPLLPSPTPIARKETSSEPPAPHPYHPSAAAAAWDLDVLERTFTTASRSATPSAVPSDDIFDADFLGSAGRAAAAATAAAATATATVAPPRMPDQALSSPAQAHHAPSPSATPDLDAFLARSPPPPPPLSSSSSSLGAVGAGIKRPVSTPPPAVASPPMAAAARHAQTPQPASAALAFPNGRSRSSVRGTTRAAHDGSSSPAVTDPAWAAHHASMVAMGFDAEESRAALRLHRGDVSAAVESVIAQSARRLPRGASPSPAAGADGLEFPGARLNAVAQAVMADPAQFLQSATTNVLSNARSMFALSKKKLGEMVEKVEQTLQDERDRRPGDAGSGSGRGESEARRREHALSRAQWEANAGVYRDDDYDNDDDGVHGGSGHGDDGESNTRRGLRDNGDGRSKPVAPMPPLVPPLDATATERGAAAHRQPLQDAGAAEAPQSARGAVPASRLAGGVPPSAAPASAPPVAAPAFPRAAAAAAAAPPLTVRLVIPAAALAAAEAEKAAGNQRFAQGQYAAAAECYTRALAMLPAHAVAAAATAAAPVATHPLLPALYNNRAAAFLKTGQYAEAVADTSAATALAPEAPWKSLVRRAAAYEALEKYALARRDYTAVQASPAAAQHLRVVQEGLARCTRALDPAPAASAPAVAPAGPSVPAASAASPQVVAANVARALSGLRDQAARERREDDERLAVKDSVDARIAAWTQGKASNLRALLTSMELVVWPELGWRPIPMAELVQPQQVKVRYMRAVARLHPDKLGPAESIEHRLLAQAAFTAINTAWDAFKAQNSLV